MCFLKHEKTVLQLFAVLSVLTQDCIANISRSGHGSIYSDNYAEMLTRQQVEYGQVRVQILTLAVQV